MDICSGDSRVLIGTVVNPDGWIVTKASDLPDQPTVVLQDGTRLKAKVVGKDSGTDLALLKIEATGLTPVKFSDDAPLGEWLVSPSSNRDQPIVGLVSNVARLIPEALDHNKGKAILGLHLLGESCVVGEVVKGMPAEMAGIRKGDEVLELNGQAVAGAIEFTSRMAQAKPGDTLNIRVRRDGNEIEFHALLGKRKMVNEAFTYNFKGGTLSKRRTNFPSAIETDLTLWADECGGPLLNLKGQTVGINIARYDDICTFAIPAGLVRQTVAKLMEGQK